MIGRTFARCETLRIVEVMGWTGTLLWLLARRLRSSWALLAITSFGILAAVTLMAVGAVYSRALAEGGIRHTLAAADPAVLDTQVVVRNRPLGPADYRKLRADIEVTVRDRLGYLLREIHRFGRTQPNWPLAVGPNGRLIPFGGPVGQPFFLTGFEDHSRLVEGRWPQAVPDLDDGNLKLEAVLGDQAASSLAVGVGSQLSLFPFRSDGSERIVLTVVGLAEAMDPREEYWLNAPGYFSVEELGEQLLARFYLPERAFLDGLAAKYPALVGDFGWLLYVDTGALTAAAAGLTKDAVTGLETDVNKRFPRSLVLTGLDNTLTDFQKELTLARVPLYLFIGLVVLVILYFLALVMGLLARYRSEEAGLLRSRGAGVLQVSGLLVAGEGMAALLAMAIGPFLALGMVRYLLLRTIDPVGAGDGGLSVGISADMFVMGAVGGLLSLSVAAAYAVSRARLGMFGSLSRRARPPTVPFLHRYYVDVLVLAALGVLWWQVTSRGGFVSRDVASRALEADPSLLFGPALALLAAGFLVLRFLPWLMRLLEWGVSRVNPAWAAFALVRLARDPLPHGSLVIILMMAAALGVFGASFQSTLSRSQREQVLYRQGGDLVLRGRSFSPEVQAAAATAPGVRTASPVARETVVLLDGLPGASATLLGVDPDTLPETSWFREDFAGKSLAELLGPLRREQPVAPAPGSDPASGVVIPAGAETIGVWVNVEGVRRGTVPQSLNLWARVRDGDGTYRNLLLGDLLAPSLEPPAASTGSEAGWTHLKAALLRGGGPLEHPSALVSFFISKRSIPAVSPGSIGIDDVTVSGPSIPGGEAIIEGYEEPGRWLPMANQAVEADGVEYAPQAARTGRAGLTFSWRAPLGDSPRGIFLPSGPYPLPAVGSASFHVGQVVRFWSGKHVAPVVINEVTGYFPTVDPASGPFLIVAREDHLRYVERLSQGRLEPPREVWVSPEQGVDRQEVILALRERVPGFISIRDRSALVEAALRNPLAGGGWNGLTILAVSAITVAVVLTLAVHGLVAVHTGRVDLTVARALGFSRAQLFLSLALERALVAILGIGAGSAIGLGLGWWVLGKLDITAGGRPVIPPMVVDVQGWLVALVLACLGASTLLALLLVTVWARRLKVPEILRAGE